VTHDQGEALSMSDRLAVFNQGEIEQVGTPREIYERPSTRFAAEFVGDSNIVERAEAAAAGVFSLRPEKVRVSAAAPGADPGVISMAGEVMDVQFHGATVRYVVSLADGSSMTAVIGNRGSHADVPTAEIGSSIWLTWNPHDMHRLSDSGRA
jgi:putative spermidine/putrescine transport system ATP-binding protein